MLWPWFRCEPKICRACSPNHCTALPKSFLWPVEALYNMATAYLSSLIPSLTISLPDLTGLCGASRPFSLIFSRTPHHGSYILLLSPHLIHPYYLKLRLMEVMETGQEGKYNQLTLAPGTVWWTPLQITRLKAGGTMTPLSRFLRILIGCIIKE